MTWTSKSSNLVEGDNNNYCGAGFLENCQDVFLYDRETDEISLVSVSYDGFGGNNDSGHPEISRNGRSIVFYSSASNLVANDTNYKSDNFAYNLLPQHILFLPLVFSN